MFKGLRCTQLLSEKHYLLLKYNSYQHKGTFLVSLGLTLCKWPPVGPYRLFIPPHPFVSKYWPAPPDDPQGIRVASGFEFSACVCACLFSANFLIFYNTVQYCTVQYITVLYSTVQYSTVQYSIVCI